MTDIVALARAVAAELGGDWTVVTNDEHPRVVLAGPDGERISPRGKSWGGANAGQLNWWGQLGPELHKYGDHHSINVGANRGARVIAKSIMSRLLVPYRATNLQALAEALPGGTVVDRGMVLFNNGGKADVSTDGHEVTLSLPSVSWLAALRIASVLRHPDVSVMPVITLLSGMTLVGGQQVLSVSPYLHPNGHDYVDLHLSNPGGDGMEGWMLPVAGWLRVAVIDDEGD